MKRLKVDNKKAISVKISDSDKEKMQKLADLYCDGNLSLWLRFAGIHFIPQKKHLIS